MLCSPQIRNMSEANCIAFRRGVKSNHCRMCGGCDCYCETLSYPRSPSGVNGRHFQITKTSCVGIVCHRLANVMGLLLSLYSTMINLPIFGAIPNVFDHGCIWFVRKTCAIHASHPVPEHDDSIVIGRRPGPRARRMCSSNCNKGVAHHSVPGKVAI